MKYYDSYININGSSKNNQDKNLMKNSLLDINQKKFDSQSFLNLSRNNHDDTVASNSIILSVISNILDIKKEDKNKKKVRKSKDKYNSQIKNSSIIKKALKMNKSSTTLRNNDNNNCKKYNLNINSSFLNSVSIQHNHTIKPNVKNEIKKANLEINSSIERNLLDEKGIKDISSEQNTIEFGKISNPKRSKTMRINRNKNQKFKETVIGMGKTGGDFPIKNKRTTKSKKNNLVFNNNFKRRSAMSNLSSYHRSSKNCLMTLTKEQEETHTNNELMAIIAFRKIHKKLKNNIVDNIKDKLYKYENNDITDAINKLPSIKPNDINNNNNNPKNHNKEIKKIENKDEFNQNYKNNNNKTYKEDNEKSFDNINNKEKYRILNLKGNVYDSLDDEEIIEEIVDNLFLTPDSDFLLIFDTIIMISSFILLIYFPLYLAKNIIFCRSFASFNNILFYVIDLFYIIDLILGFFRAFYNFDEILIRNSNDICKHYLNTWFFLDLIAFIPIFSIIKFFENKCSVEFEYLHSLSYNNNLNNLHFILAFFKIVKIYKVFNNNISFKKFKHILLENEFINDWGNVLLFVFFFIFSINISACLFIFVGRNTYESWIINYHFENLNFWHIYVAAIYYIVMTITTVGYGDLVGKSLIEFIFQAVILISGTCIYSWLISSASSYIKKMNDINIHYENRLKILDEIKLSNPRLSKSLYEKIIRLLNYRRYYEETDKHEIIELLPYSLRNTLIIEMYKPFINNFIFFKNIKNRDFIVQVVSKLKPALSVKGDMVVQEGDFIEDIIFVKDGLLSLEIKIDLDYPDKSIEDYLNKNNLITLIVEKKKSSKFNQQTMNFHRDKEIKSHKLFKSKFLEVSGDSNVFNNLFNNSKLTNNSFSEDNENISFIKIINLRKNEHFGDVFMFLNERSPLYVRVRSKKVELLLLRKLDAVSISTTYPKIWKKIIAKSLINTKKIKNLTLKMLVIFCNFHGIKTKFFKEQKYCLYDLKNLIPNNLYNSNFVMSKRKSLPLNEEIKHTLKEINEVDSDDNSETSNDTNDLEKTGVHKNNNNQITTVIEEQDEGNSFETLKKSTFKNNKLLTNKKKNNYSIFKSKQDLISLNLKSEIDENNSKKSNNLYEKIKSSKLINDKNEKKLLYTKTNFNNNHKKINNFNNKNIQNKVNNSSISSKNEDSNSISSDISSSISSKSSNNDNSSKTSNNSISSEIQSPINNFNKKCNNDSDKNINIKNKFFNSIIKNESNKIKDIKANNSFNKKSLEDINEEIYLGEDFNIQLYNDSKIINSKKEIKKFCPDKIYINNLNIFENNYLEQIFQNQKNNISEKTNKSKSEEKNNYYKSLKISSESIMQIDSSYENINQLTNYNYISDDDLRQKTKKFLFKECDIHLSEASILTSNNNIRKSFNKSKSISQNILDKLENYNSHDRSKSNEKVERLNKKKSIIQSTIQTFKSFKHGQLPKFKMSTINNYHFLKKINNTIEEKEIKHHINEKDKYRSNISNKNVSNKNISNKNLFKKTKKNKEIDMISNNIKRNTQNLKNPELFYTGLFNNIIEKQKKKNVTSQLVVKMKKKNKKDNIRSKK